MIVPHYFQLGAKQAVFDYFENGGKGNPLVCMPTGTGKSIVIADLLRDIFGMYPNQRVMMLTHVWKLIEQNASKMQNMWPTAPIGIHSAGLGHRDTIMPIVFGGVQSVAKTLDKDNNAFGHRDLILIDEAHLLGSDEDSQYVKTIATLTKINPYLKVIGFTATPYRMKMGLLTDGQLFSDICFDITTHEWFLRLISEGYLTPLIGKPTNTRIDGIGNLSMVGGDYNAKQAEALVDREEITYSACKEALEYGGDRRKMMAFAAGVDNAEHIAEMFQSFGVPVACVHSKLSAEENKRRLDAYARGELWGVVGANMLTTGYDNQEIDLILDFQPTCSTGKHVQKLGRGTRVFPGKNNTLVLDFVGNIARNGPIDDPRKPKPPGARTGEPPPIKICSTDKLVSGSGCGAYNHASVRFCCNCAAEFHFRFKVVETAYADAPMKQADNPIIERVELNKPVLYRRNEGKQLEMGIAKPPTVKVTYILGIRPINIFLCFEHTGKARRLAQEWWMRHSPNPVPKTVDEFLSRTGELRVPKALQVQTNLKYPEIQAYEF